MASFLPSIIVHYLSGKSETPNKIPEGITSAAIRGPATPPTEWQEAGTVAKLYLYPIKSCKGTSVSNALALKGGLKCDSCNIYDRQFVVTDAKGKFITGRKFPKMVLVEATIDMENELVLKATDMKEIRMKLPDWKSADREEIEIWGQKCLGFDLGPAVSHWLSQFITGNPEFGLKLFWHGDTNSTSRPLHKDENNKKMGLLLCLPLQKPHDMPFYADSFPYLILSQESINDLNIRLKSLGVNDLEVDERRFRPNIFVTGLSKPYLEDNWPYIKIGEAVFRSVTLAPRCVFTTVDPDLGVYHKDRQPLKTLQTYRLTLDPAEKKSFGMAPLLATKMGVEVEGMIKVGDKVFISKEDE